MRRSFTFLFTDIERSSELWEKHPQAMGRALDGHDRLLRGIFAEHRGHLFKTMGDAFCVAFESASDAVRSTIAAQRALADEAWEDIGPLRVRMALHSGEAELRESDYFGPTLNRVARVLSAGHGGQTLVTRAIADNIRVWLPAHVSLRDLGERRLRDLSSSEHIYQLDVEGLPVDFPPLRSLEVLPNNLPAQVTSFVGRAREMVEVKRLLELTRLLTLTGPGGSGKTRLSLQIAADMLDQFPHGVWLVELATISEGATLAETIMSAIGIREEAERPALSTLLDTLRSRSLLIVLDNCEHLIADCAQIATSLLRQCAGVKILASSREPMNIEGETLWPVAALSVPPYHEADLELEDISKLESVQLFVERATLVRPDFRLTSENCRLVAEICWRLDGIPLALELAAARIKVLPLPQILERLDDRFRLLTGGSRTALPRQQTLSALIGWSYDLLSEPERILLRRLSIFVAGRTQEMAEEVCSGDGLDRYEVFDLLCSLAEKSLIMVETGPQGENRYTMLESIWDYADEKLKQHGETERYSRRHLDFFVAFAEMAEPQLYRAQQKVWLDRLSADQRNFQRAISTSLEKPETAELGLRLAGALARYWEIRSHLTEAYEQLTELLRAAGANASREARAKAEMGAGIVSWCQERSDDAIRHFRAASKLYHELGIRYEIGFIEGYLASIERNRGNHENAREHLRRTSVIAEEVDSDRLRALAIYGLAGLPETEADLPKSRELKEKAVRMYEAQGDRWVAGLLKGGLAGICLAQKDYVAARELIIDVLMISREFGSKWSIPYALEGLAEIALAQGQPAKALRLYAAAASQRETLAVAYSRLEQAAFDGSMAKIRELMTPESLHEELEKGRAMGLEAAIILATEN